MSRKKNLSRLESEYHDRLEFIEGDITVLEQVQSAISSIKPELIIHLAALQTPDCMAHPLQGMEVNVVGTRNVVQAAYQLGDRLERLVLASSSAVYGPRDMYPGETVMADVPYRPANLYGYWKICNEGMGQAFHRETGISTVCIRLSTCYGPGRDLGMTSAPTAMLKCAAAGKSFRMPCKVVNIFTLWEMWEQALRALWPLLIHTEFLICVESRFIRKHSLRR